MRATSWEREDVKGPINVTLFHGTRQFGSLPQIRERGISQFGSADEVREHAIEALKSFGKSESSKGFSLAQGRIRAFERAGRRSIYATPYESASSSWATRNPEIISDVLYASNVPKREATKYLESRYGRRRKVKFAAVVPKSQFYRGYGSTDISTGLSHIGPSRIVEVSNFPQDTFLAKYRGKGWIRLQDLSKTDRSLLRSMEEEEQDICRDYPSAMGLDFRYYKGRLAGFRVV